MMGLSSRMYRLVLGTSLLFTLIAVAATDSSTNHDESDISKELKAGARSSTNMKKTEMLSYAIGTAISVPLGYFSMKMPTSEMKQMFHLAAGLVISIAICGTNVLHQVFVSTVTFIIIKFLPSIVKPHAIVFGWTMSYLLFFRLCHLRFPEWPDKSGPNGAMMMITSYRLISAAFDVRGQPLKMMKNGEKVLEERCPSPSPLMFFSYIFSFAGLVVGPVLIFRDYTAYLNQNFVELPESTMTAIKERTKKGCLWAALYVTMLMCFPKPPLNELLQGWQGITFAVELIGTLALSLYTTRFQYYVVWSISEQGLMWAGIGGTPEGYKLDQISCVEPAEVEVYSWLMDSDKRHVITHMIKFWNMSVQRWLVRYVYRQFPVPAIRTLVVFIVSAYMHGVSIGFFAFFVQLAIFDIIQKRWQNIAWTPPFKNIAIVRWTYLFIYYNFVFRHFEYIIYSFHMPSVTFSKLFTIFECVGYYGHISGAVFLVLVMILPQQQRPLTRVFSEVEMAKKDAKKRL